MARLDILQRFLRLLALEADGSIRTRLAASLLLALIGSSLIGLAPLALKSLIDSMTPEARALPTANGGHPAILFGAGYLVALCLGRVLADLRPLLAGIAEQQLHARISRRYFAHLLELPLGFHSSRQTGALTNGLSQATAACQLITNSLMQCTPVMAELVTVLVVLGHLGQPVLVVIFVASAAAYSFIFASGASRVRTHGRAVSDASLRVHATLTDSLLNIETIKCFNAGAAMCARFGGATAELEGRWSRLHRQRARMALQVSAVFAASIASSLLVAAEAVSRDALTIGGFVLATVYMLQMVRPLELLGSAVRDVTQALEFARPLLEVLDEVAEGVAHKPALHDGTRGEAGLDEGQSACGGPPAITFRNVRLAYQDDRPVLKHFNLEVAAGTTVAIVGASGAGKSSIARLLLRLLDPQAGRILWDRRPLHRLPLQALRGKIGFVPQDTTLFNDTIANNIAISRLGASRREIEDAARRAQLHTLAASLPEGYDTQVGERGLKLSGGERQRIAIARAILMRPQVYLFDEVSSMLDGPTEAAILRELREHCAGCTTIFITHRLAAARSADLVVVLEDGKVAECGSHEELLALPGSYRSMWQAQAGRGANRHCADDTTSTCGAPRTTDVT